MSDEGNEGQDSRRRLDRRIGSIWETHDVTDYLNELEEVTEPIFASGVKVVRPVASEEEIDKFVIAEVADDAAWEEPIKVKQVPERPDSRK